MPARLEVIAGPMFSGKTEELIRRIKRETIARRRVLVLKPFVDTRTEAFIASRAVVDGRPVFVEKYPATIVRGADELSVLLKEHFDTLALDEAQFFDAGYFAYAIRETLDRRKTDDLLVIAAGLDMTFSLEPFGPMPQLMAMADEVTKLTAICMACHARGARLTQRLRGGLAQVQIGDAGDYEVRCRACHFIPCLSETDE